MKSMYKVGEIVVDDFGLSKVIEVDENGTATAQRIMTKDMIVEMFHKFITTELDEEKGDLISRQALKEAIDDITWYHINPYGELVEGAHGDSDALFKAEDIYNAIDNALPISPYKAIHDELHKGEEK